MLVLDERQSRVTLAARLAGKTAAETGGSLDERIEPVTDEIETMDGAPSPDKPSAPLYPEFIAKYLSPQTRTSTGLITNS